MSRTLRHRLLDNVRLRMREFVAPEMMGPDRRARQPKVWTRQWWDQWGMLCATEERICKLLMEGHSGNHHS